MKILTLFIATLVLFNCPHRAQAESTCGLSLSLSNVNLVWSASFATQQLTFTLRKSKGKACNYSVTFSKGTSNPSNYNRYMLSGTNQLNYQLYKENSLTNILKDYPDATTNNDVITGSFSSSQNQTQTLTYYLQIPYNLATQPHLKPPGNYTDSFVVKAFDLTNGGTTTPDSNVTVSVSTSIARNIQLSLVSTGGGFDPNSTTQSLNFGTLTQGATLGFDLRVLSNAGFAVTFSSQNNGVLKLTGSPTSPATTVSYTLTVNGAAKNLSSSQSSPVTVASGSGQTTTSGVANPVAVTIGSVSNKMAGSYSDNITVSVATTE